MMNIFFLLIDLSMPLVMAYLVLKKGSLSIVYIPFFYFMYSMQEKSKIIAIYQVILVGLLIYYALYNLPFLKKNIFYIILVVFFSFQLRVLDDFKSIRYGIIGLYWTFTIIALAPEICKSFPKAKIFEELGFAAFLLLFFFIINTGLSTVFGYYPTATYGFKSGISFGNISVAQYSVFPFAVFLSFRRAMVDKKPLYFIVSVISLFLIMLTLRRMVMALSLLAVIAVMIELLNFKQLKQFALYGLVFIIMILGVLKTSGFGDQLIERMEKRNLKERELEGEGRILELGLLYKDLFVYYEYDPWFGYGPLSSGGNYGKKIFGDRPMHTDIGYYIHGFGFFGLFLYLGMISIIFYGAWKRCESRGDLLVFLFTSLSFVAFFLVGSPKLPLLPVLMFLTLGILYGKKEPKKIKVKMNSLVLK